MKILGIDSSTTTASVSLIQDSCILYETTNDRTRTHSDKALEMVDQVLKHADCQLNEIDGFCVTSGPGSFTGLRVGVSLAKGLVMVVQKPLFGASTLEAVARSIPRVEGPICAFLDARKKQVYAALFQYEGETLERLSGDRAMNPEALCDEIIKPTIFVGSGLETYESFFREQLGERFLDAPKPMQTIASSAALLGRSAFLSNSQTEINQLTIQYARKAEAEFKQPDITKKEGRSNGN
ncbi:MAG: tRNA (adenosine(37)-N6)-threonylcarbamoyltransferase complex dimerization subunit type 1 TsaB [Candidatus Nitrohelix vancouverensis]|uniref:tRNA (Adenosine(37)-N6)-threonylcarbamoyltransferase complex dimerization subunit type 1 TsaB n=1 Tax=Candidatus Nitrohelix vancouverensis TaxID=2705534 RepID=A0A7T0C3D3_9BACT|nr:MAG: tRNA (adenosine(37)-N6)-threonylcarbamoyltransferase complex dimerization subunit type 1 TsaB [Candidatus Nitrohelix vancouverensis]